jgi:hypothetical protein
LVPVSAEVELLSPEVKLKADQFVASLVPALQKIQTPLSLNCRGCEYRANAGAITDGYKECWGELADVKPHLFDLYHLSSVGGRGGPIPNRLIEERKVSLFDLHKEDLVDASGELGERNKRQSIQIEHTRDNTEWFSDELPEILRCFDYPLHFIDFETTALAIPYHAGMPPYESVAFQWSCHTLRSPESPLEHAEWINVENTFPNFDFAESLMHNLGSTGTFFMWATHENTILGTILRQMRERQNTNFTLQSWIEDTIRTSPSNPGRLVDLNQLTLKHYFHPLMKGRTSIKVVVDAIWKSNPALRAEFPEYLRERNGIILSPYKSLPQIEINGKSLVVAEGTSAIRAYEAMLYGVEREDRGLKHHWKRLLLQYCQLDTLSMVMVWRHWLQRLTNSA